MSVTQTLQRPLANLAGEQVRTFVEAIEGWEANKWEQKKAAEQERDAREKFETMMQKSGASLIEIAQASGLARLARSSLERWQGVDDRARLALYRAAPVLAVAFDQYKALAESDGNGSAEMLRVVRERLGVSVSEARRRELARVTYLAAVDKEAREEAAKAHPQLSGAFALDAAFEKAVSAVLAGSKEAVLEMMTAFRAQVARKLETGELLPEVHLSEAVEISHELWTTGPER